MKLYINKFSTSIFLCLIISTVCYSQTTTPPSQTAAGVNNLVAGYGVDQLSGSNNNYTALFYQSADSVYNLLIGSVVNQILPVNLSQIIPANPALGTQNPNNQMPTLLSQAVYTMLTNTNPASTLNTLSQIPAPIPGQTVQFNVFNPVSSNALENSS